MREAGITDDVPMDEDNVKDDGDFDGPEQKRAKPTSFTLKFEDKEWIRKLCKWADAHKVKSKALLELCQKLILTGGGDLSEITLSLATIDRLREDERKHAHFSTNLAEYDRFVTVHFDGKRCWMGLQQGHQVLEHLAVFVSGISGVKQLGIEIAANSTGKQKSPYLLMSQCKRIQNLTCQNDLYDTFYFIYSKIFY